MPLLPTIVFAKPGKAPAGVAVILATADNRIAEQSRIAAGPTLDKALAAADYKGKANAAAEILVPAGTGLDRLIVVGTGKADELDESAWLKLGGTVASKLGKAKSASVLLEIDGAAISADAAADFALGRPKPVPGVSRGPQRLCGGQS